MKVIEKKILMEYFGSIESGKKTFELRKEDDVRYEVGDIVVLKAIDKNGNYLPGEEIPVEVTYVLRNFEGLEDGYCICGIKVLNYE